MLLDRDAHFLGEIVLGGVVVRQEFVQRRVEEADGRRQTLQFLEDARRSLRFLIGQEFRQRFFAVGDVLGENHFAHGVDAIAFEEHVFRAAQADAAWRRTRRRWRSARDCPRWCAPAGA